MMDVSRAEVLQSGELALLAAFDRQAALPRNVRSMERP
jgi:hypothetical protein